MLSSAPDDRCTLSDSSAGRFVNFGAIYFAQGLPMGFAVFAVPAWLADTRMPTADIGMVGAITMLPWAFKVVWAPLVDRFKYRAMGRFRAWILGAQLGLVASTVALLSLPSPVGHVRALAGALFAQALFASMSDVAGDGLAVEVLPNRQRGLANAVMSGAQAAGNVIGGAGLSAVLARAGFREAAGLSLVLLLAACAPTVLLRERPGERLLPWTRGEPAIVAADRAPLALAGSARLLARSVLARPSARALAVWIAVSFLSGCLGILMTAAAVRDHGFRPAEYASLGALALAPNLIGAFAGGRLADRRGRAPVVVGALLLDAVAWAGFGLLSPEWSIKGVWIVQALAAGAASGALFTVLTALFMDLTEPRLAATQFAMCMALGNLGSVIGRASAGALEARLPLAWLALAAGAALAALALWTATSPAIPPMPRKV
ncbi:MAG: MFS transporter [Polyangiaceae bacterium]|jgi:PAT family beta-lactamase induction signal transducer AmpG